MTGIAALCVEGMMGWMQGIAGWFWSVINGSAGTSSLEWLGENWLRLVLMILVLGTVIDVLVRLGRWGTLQVYASFFRRLRGDKPERNTAEPVEEIPPVLPGQAQPQEGSLLQRAVQSVKESLADSEEEIRYQPAAPAFNKDDIYRPPVMPPVRPVETGETAEDGTRRRRRRGNNA